MKKILFAAGFILMTAGIASSHPPTDLVLKYDQKAKVLEVRMRHVTEDIREHYVRTITVSVNGQEPKGYRYTHQQYPSYVDVFLPVEAKPGDMIHVQANCLKGGSIEGDLKIEKEEDAGKKTP